MAAADDDYEWFWRRLDQFLNEHQLKQTDQRREIVRELLAAQTHVDAEDLHRSLRRGGHNIGMATVYRTLNLLRKAGLVEQQSFADGRMVYEVLRPNEHHDHLVCSQCGYVVEFYHPELESLKESVARDMGYRLTSHRLDLFGDCLQLDRSGACPQYDPERLAPNPSAP